MGKMSELAAELAELKRCGEALIGISETLTEIFSGTDAEPAAETKEEKPAIKTERTKKVTLAEVRAVLAEKSRQGHTAEVKKLLSRYGADKLSEVDPAKYGELKAEAEVLGDG
ncbi:MAG: DNA ligase [Clostridium sp.]|nr:DNA ligase [Clostridium sp.]